MINLKRYRAESQGDSKRIWNVIDTWNGSYARFALSGHAARHDAIQLANELNSKWWRNGIIRVKLDRWHDAIMDLVFGRR